MSESSRRRFLQQLSAGLLAGCMDPQPLELVVPWVRRPEETVPGVPRFYATTLPVAGYGQGALAVVHSARPTHIEGNPEHPASLGTSDPWMHASVLDLYDPDRSKLIRAPGHGHATWAQFDRALRERLQRNGGEGFHILTGQVTSPTQHVLLARALARWPGASWHRYEPVGQQAVREGARRAFGRPLEPVYAYDEAAVAVFLDDDPVQDVPGHLRYAHDLGRGRRPRAPDPSMSRLYAAEPAPSLTGLWSDDRIAVRSSHVGLLALALARALEVTPGLPEPGISSHEREWVDRLARDLKRHRGKAVVSAGRGQPPAVHVLVAALNGWLDAPMRWIRPPGDPDPVLGLEPRDLTGLEGGHTLLVMGANPTYDLPGQIPDAEWLIHFGERVDETAERATWHLPMSHPLESWGDLRAYDGTASIIQPLFRGTGGRSPVELLQRLAGESLVLPRERVRRTWDGSDFAHALRLGVLPGTAAPAEPVVLSEGAVAQAAGEVLARQSSGLELVLRPHSRAFDGRYANNAWLQELPDPVTSLTWGNALWLSPARAAELGVGNEDVVSLTHEGGSVDVPVWKVEGVAEDTVLLTLGLGRRTGVVGKGVGVDVFPLRPAKTPWVLSGVELEPAHRTAALANVQHELKQHHRPILLTGKLATLRDDPKQLHHHHPHHTMYPDRLEGSPQWGMSIDLTACMGCGACTIACQSENNIPVVGPGEVRMGREMHWIRIDNYHTEHGPMSFQPVPCMHCERAPCEVVCPTGATQHSHDGLNEMIYNRCVGTRYCSNNCPYKIRRFNFYPYANREPSERVLQRNPSVTVRERGVMEKCTYCVQRIRAADAEARKSNRRILDMEVITACQAACPTRAIVFGDVADPDTEVSQAKEQPHDYALLAELNTRPRTTYLRRIHNRGEADG